MKRFLSVLTMCVVLSGSALAVPQVFLTPVKATHSKTKRHKAHKAAKHPRTKRQHHTV
jgi:hypothetical protein